MKKPLSIITATAILAGCSQSTAVKFTLTGRDPAFTDGKYMYIITYAGGPETIIDSARIDNSSFAMKGSWPYPVSAFLYMGRGADGEQISDSDFILETGEIRVEKRNEDEFILTGTPQNEFRNELPQKVAGLRQKGLSPLRTAEACDSLFRAVVLENRNALALSLLENELLTNRPGRELLPLLDSFPAAFQKHPALLGLRKTIAGMRADVGTSYADITGQTPEGDTVSLAATVRKPGNRYVLLDFGEYSKADWTKPGGVPEPRCALREIPQPGIRHLRRLLRRQPQTVARMHRDLRHALDADSSGIRSAPAPDTGVERLYAGRYPFLLPDRLCDGKDHSQTTAGRSPRAETLRTARLTAYEPTRKRVVTDNVTTFSYICRKQHESVRHSFDCVLFRNRKLPCNYSGYRIYQEAGKHGADI